MSTFSLSLDIDQLLSGIEADIAAVDAATRPAAQAGAQVLYEAVQRNVAGIKRHSGNLASSIYQAYSKDHSGRGHATYHVSWNAKKAPHGHLVEYGHLQRYEVTYDPKTRRFTTHKDRPLPAPKQVAARPFVRPAIAAMPQAQAAMRARYLAELQAKGVIK